MRRLIEDALAAQNGITAAVYLALVCVVLAGVYAWNRSKTDDAGATLYGLYLIVVMGAGSLIGNGERSPDILFKVAAWTVGITAAFQFIGAVAHLTSGKPFLASVNYLASILSTSVACTCAYYAGWDDGTTTSLYSAGLWMARMALAVVLLPIGIVFGFGVKKLVNRYQARQFRRQSAAMTQPHSNRTATPGTTGQLVVSNTTPPLSDRIPAAPPTGK